MSAPVVKVRARVTFEVEVEITVSSTTDLADARDMAGQIAAEQVRTALEGESVITREPTAVASKVTAEWKL